MKKYLLLLLLIGSALLSSCEDNPTDALIPAQALQNHLLKANINGTDVFFNQTSVVKQEITEGGITYTDLIVTANKENDTSKQIIFRMEYMQTGTETCYYFLYKVGDAEHDIETNDSFTTNVTQSTANNIKGTFSGTLEDFEGNPVTISNGNFDISF